MTKNILVDYIPFNFSAEAINESIERNGGKLIVSGVIQRANSLNQNKRNYPKNILLREVEKYQKNLVGTRRAMGELDHPESPIVNLSNVSHIIIEMNWDGDNLMGKLEILDTPAGKIARELFKSGVSLGISSRGLGSVKPLGEGAVEVQDDFELVAFDLVSNPSTHGAFLHESANSLMSLLPNQYQRANQIITDILSCK